MAGKLYTQQTAYATSSSTHMAKVPGRLVRAYAEGYVRNRNGGALGDNPHPAGTPAKTAWDQGFTDRAGGSPPGHVGGP